jgi:hypothetical protein
LWAPRNPGWPTAKCAIERLIGKCIGPAILLAWHMARTPMRKARQPLQGLIAEWGKFRIAHLPSALQLLHHQLAIKQQIDLSRSELRSKVYGCNNFAPLCNVIRRCTDRSGDRSDRHSIWIVGSGRSGVIECDAD